jgi:GGDEF domain-containing protein
MNLASLASRIRAACRDCDCEEIQHPGGFVARYGGEEFAIVLLHCEPNTGMLVAERPRRAVSETCIPAVAKARHTRDA